RNGASQGVPAEAATMASNLASNQGPASNSNPVFNSLWTTGMVTAGAPANIPGQPVWKISSAGTLQKSVDSGRTWDDLALPPGARLRAASAVGDQVWLGASGAVLYHSTDGGKQWMRVIPFARGTQLSGEVLAIEFADPQHGSVTTSTGSRWTTLDAGRTWNVQ
ncbi:MAG TPA: YCF48-related protein, partial [Terriglobales bacterium]|nr:YCF48-related protein [Terriglobales bacterium]